MKYSLGLVSVSFRKHTPKEILAAMRSAELEFVEWGSDVHVPPDKAGEIAALQDAYGISCCSYGTYFKLGVTPLCELQAYIGAAKILGTRIIRLWCGNKNSEEYTEDEKAELFATCKAAAGIAENNGAVLCMECHGGTYTNTKESAYELILAVDSKAFRMYWQPNQHRTVAENLEYAKLLSPYTEHLHVFNWSGNKRYSLWEAKDVWREYLGCYDTHKTLLLEFMPDDRIETLKNEAAALKEIAK
ncbi:MAG: sugar phosphate isomerase/epimerase [Clostridia bacterium]|nr:sugar phosphate isomerase/epimerase [Clostridia bacterium]